MSVGWAFLVQAFVSIEVSFAANWKFVFRTDLSFRESLMAPFRQDKSLGKKWQLLRDSDAWKCFWKFNFSRGIFIPLDQIVFLALVWMGMQFLIANVVETAVFTLANYMISWLWSFRKVTPKSVVNTELIEEIQARQRNFPQTAVVIPVKGSQLTLRSCVSSLLAQNVPAGEIILVGDSKDRSWEAIDDFIREDRVTVLEATIDSQGRDANAKRTIGLDYAAQKGYTVMALTDSDMVLPTDWLQEGLTQILLGWECVAGPMRSVATGFWPSYVDKNPILPKTPRMARDYVLDDRNFGKRKPPVTANVFFTAAVYRQTGGLDANFVRDYEDYEFFARMVGKGVRIFCTQSLEAAHNHREGFRTLARDYVASGWGCADFVAFRPESTMAKQRLREVRLVRTTLVLGPILFLGLLVSQLALPAVATALSICVLLASYSAVKARSLMGMVFPFVTGFFLVAFLRGFAKGRTYNKRGPIKTTVEAVSQLQIQQGRKSYDRSDTAAALL